MAVTTRLAPIRKDIELFLADLRGPAAGEQLRIFAQEQIDEAKRTNAQVLGRVPPFQMFVNGSKVNALPLIRANSTIVVEFELIADVLTFIDEQLIKFSPVLIRRKNTPRRAEPGLYKRSHILLADGSEVTAGKDVPIAKEYVFVNTVPYARKIERGSSSQAPDGVYQATATLAKGRFGNIARITYSFRTVIGGQQVGGRLGDRSPKRNPAVIVRPNA